MPAGESTLVRTPHVKVNQDEDDVIEFYEEEGEYIRDVKFIWHWR